jgi:signal transduction histidine kinase
MRISVIEEAASATDTLWLETLQRLSSRAAHELKGVLNGVSVNLEVVRSRAEKLDTPSAAISKYANVASDQFGAVIDMTEALLSLARAVNGAVEVGALARRVVDLLGPVVRADGRQLDLDGSTEAIGVTSAGGNAVRLAITAGLLAATEESTHVVCSGELGGLRIAICDGRPVVFDPAVAAALAQSDIEVRTESSAIVITFPR